MVRLGSIDAEGWLPLAPIPKPVWPGLLGRVALLKRGWMRSGRHS